METISAVSDATLVELSPSGTFRAMVKEIEGLTGVKAGNVLKQKGWNPFAPNLASSQYPVDG